MKIFFADSLTIVLLKYYKKYKIKSYLESYFKLRKLNDGHEWSKVMKQNAVDLFLDSGAFSAWTKGGVLDIDAYIEYVKENKDLITVYANMDVIGDAEGTYKNQKYIEKKGLKPMPVFHSMYEDEKWLARYLKEGYDYIALGGMAGSDIKTTELTYRMDYLWQKYLVEKDGTPKVKIHGFGMTSLPLMVRYPWYSVDSTSWVLTGRFGAVIVPIKYNGKYDYTKPAMKIQVSNRSGKTKDEGQHFSTLTKPERMVITEYFKKYGMVIGESEFNEEGKETIITPGLMNDYKMRDELNIIYFMELEKALPAWPWKYKRATTKGLGL